MEVYASVNVEQDAIAISLKQNIIVMEEGQTNGEEKSNERRKNI